MLVGGDAPAHVGDDVEQEAGSREVTVAGVWEPLNARQPGVEFSHEEENEVVENVLAVDRAVIAKRRIPADEKAIRTAVPAVAQFVAGPIRNLRASKEGGG